MLLCPQCKFENPNNHKFCQKCGTSLTHKKCPQCGSKVAWSEKNCQNCGAFTGLVWMAVVAKTVSFDAVGMQEDRLAGAIPQDSVALVDEREEITRGAGGDRYESKIEPASTETEFDNVGEVQTDSTIALPDREAGDCVEIEEPEEQGLDREKYIDCQERYQLLETLPPTKEGDVELVRVLDCQPLQISPLKALLDTKQMPTEPTNKPSGAQTLVKSENNEIEALVTPEIAKGYLTLKRQFPYNLPAVHDAWQQKGEQVVLLEDCSDWPWLWEEWENDETPQQQLVEWLHQMSELWVALQEWHCRQSLLELDNLRVYPTKVGDYRPVCLQRLYSDEKEVKLEEMIMLWLDLFHRSQRTLFGPLADLVHDLRSGRLRKIEEVRSRLLSTKEQLKQEEGASSPSTKLQSEDISEEETAIAEETTFIRARQLVALESVGRTHVGRMREHNEDYFGIQGTVEKVESPNGTIVDAKGLYIICDGMGGHAGGEIASKFAVNILKQYFQGSWQGELPSETVIRGGILEANQAIYDLNEEEVRSGSARMGTTLVMALVRNTKVAIAHVGDSRIYRYTRSQGLQQLTVDHEVGQREIKRGVEPHKAYSRPDAYQLTQALGPRDEDYVRPEVRFLDFEEDTVVILASDGLTDNGLLENYWESHIAPLLEPERNLEEGIDEAIALANEENGHDNITVIAIVAKVRPRR